MKLLGVMLLLRDEVIVLQLQAFAAPHLYCWIERGTLGVKYCVRIAL